MYFHAPAGTKPIESFVVSNNIVTDRIGTDVNNNPVAKTQEWGMVFSYSGTTFSAAVITNNVLTGNINGGINGLNVNDITKGIFAGNVTDSADTFSVIYGSLYLKDGMYFKEYTHANLPTPISGRTVVCLDCTGAAICNSGGGRRIAIADGSNWTCN